MVKIFLLFFLMIFQNSRASCPVNISVEVEKALHDLDFESVNKNRKDLIIQLEKLGPKAKKEKIIELNQKILMATAAQLRQQGVAYKWVESFGHRSIQIVANNDTPLNRLAKKMQETLKTRLIYNPTALSKFNVGGMFDEGKPHVLLLNHTFFNDERWADEIFSHEIFHNLAAKKRAQRDTKSQFYDWEVIDINQIPGNKNVIKGYEKYLSLEELPANTFSLNELGNKFKKFFNEGKTDLFFQMSGQIMHGLDFLQKMAQGTLSVSEHALKNLMISKITEQNNHIICEIKLNSKTKINLFIKKNELPAKFSIAEAQKLIIQKKDQDELNFIVFNRLTSTLNKIKKYQEAIKEIKPLSDELYFYSAYLHARKNPSFRAEIVTLKFKYGSNIKLNPKPYKKLLMNLPQYSLANDQLALKNIIKLQEQYNHEIKKILNLRFD